MTTVLITIAAVLGANVFNKTFDEAVLAYGEGNYEAATAQFEQLVASGVVDADVFYNLGNAYYRQGALGPAIANYERALQLEPNSAYIRENLVRAVNDTRRRMSGPRPSELEQGFFFWHYNLSAAATRNLAIVFWYTFWALLAVRLLWKTPFVRTGAVVVGVAAAAFGASAWVKAYPDMVVVANDVRVPVRYGTNETETVRFELYEGDRVLAEEVTEGWVRVATTDGDRGWAQREQFTFVGPPYWPPGYVPANE